MRHQTVIDLHMREVGRTPLLTAAQEVELAQRIERGDAAARQHMINANLRLVVGIAQRYASQVSKPESMLRMEDVIQQGYLGLIRAVDKFDYRKGFKFSTYADAWIRNFILNGFSGTSDQSGQSMIRLPAKSCDDRKKIIEARNRLSEAGRPQATVVQLADITGIPVARVEIVLAHDRLLPASLDHIIEEDASLSDFVADEAAISPELAATQADNVLNLRGIIDRMEPHLARVICLRYGFDDHEPRTQRQVAKLLGLSQYKVYELERDARQWLLEHCGDELREYANEDFGPATARPIPKEEACDPAAVAKSLAPLYVPAA